MVSPFDKNNEKENIKISLEIILSHIYIFFSFCKLLDTAVLFDDKVQIWACRWRLPRRQKTKVGEAGEVVSMDKVMNQSNLFWYIHWEDKCEVCPVFQFSLDKCRYYLCFIHLCAIICTAVPVPT